MFQEIMSGGGGSGGGYIGLVMPTANVPLKIDCGFEPTYATLFYKTKDGIDVYIEFDYVNNKYYLSYSVYYKVDVPSIANMLQRTSDGLILTQDNVLNETEHTVMAIKQ